MSAIREAQDRALDDAREAFINAQAGLDQVKGIAERLNEAHLLPEDLFWEGIGAIDGMCGMLDDLIKAVTP